ncbi:unnamed protein product [Brassica oleracea]
MNGKNNRRHPHRENPIRPERENAARHHHFSTPAISISISTLSFSSVADYHQEIMLYLVLSTNVDSPGCRR